MASIIFAFYGVLFLGYLFATLFIVFHFSRYSLSKTGASAIITLFLVTTGALLLANVSLFLAIPWNTVFASVFNTSL